jgi:hypothetical protein
MTGVQIIGSKAVIERYGKLNYETWALYQGKQFIVGGNNGNELSEWLSDFEATGSTAVYTLRVYDGDQIPTSSTGNADYIACLNFKVSDTYEGYGIAGHNNKLMDRIKGLEEKLERKDDNEESGGIGDIIMGWFEDPNKLAIVAGVVRQLMGGVPVPQVGALPAPIQTISGLDPQKSTSMEDSLTRISKALDTLEKYDPQLVVHLEKLAMLASTDTLLFKAVISKLDAL